MRKTTLTIDDEKVSLAREILGTAGITNTIDAALSKRLPRRGRSPHRRMSTMDGLDLADAEVMADAWR